MNVWFEKSGGAQIIDRRKLCKHFDEWHRFHPTILTTENAHPARSYIFWHYSQSSCDDDWNMEFSDDMRQASESNMTSWGRKEIQKLSVKFEMWESNTMIAHLEFPFCQNRIYHVNKVWSLFSPHLFIFVISLVKISCVTLNHRALLFDICATSWHENKSTRRQTRLSWNENFKFSFLKVTMRARKKSMENMEM